MDKVKILLTAFRNTSSELLLNKSSDYKKLLLPNDKIKDSEIVIDTISNDEYDYVFCFGQKPLLTDKVAIEITAKEGNFYIDTSFAYDELRLFFEENGIDVRLSRNAGTSFCNRLYFNCLKYTAQKNLNTRVIFIHIPTGKNISDIDMFFAGILRVISRYKM